MNINEYLDEAKDKLGITSDYAFASTTGIARGAISKYRDGSRTNIEEYVIYKLAEILEMDARAITADLKSQTETNDTKKQFWTETVSKLKRGLSKLRIIHIMLNRIFLFIKSIIHHNWTPN